MSYDMKMDEYYDLIERWLLGGNPDVGLVGTETPKRDDVLDSINRKRAFVLKNGVNPNWVTICPPKQVSDGWYRNGDFDFENQETSYWCAPASLAMATNEQKQKHAQEQLASLFGTNTSGTSHEQIINGMNQIGFDVKEVWVKDMTIQKLADYALDTHTGVICHIQLTDSDDYKKSMCYDWTGNKLYQTYRRGHYIFNWAVNPTKGIVMDADPARSMRYDWWQQLWYGCRYTEMNVGVSGFLVVSER